MKRLLAIILLGLAALGCNAPADDAPLPDAFILYSIDGNDYPPPAKRPVTAEEFHGYPVLGKRSVTEAAKRQELAAALRQGIDERGGGSKCFTPRHGVRMVWGDRWIDQVICFECEEVYEYNSSSGEKPVRDVGVRASLKDILNRYLTAAGVPLAPEADAIPTAPR